MASNNVLTLTSDSFKAELAKTGSAPLLVDFWAPWCGPCRMVAPLVDQIADENVGKFAVGKVNVDEAADIAAEFGIQSIPTLIIFKGGQKVDQIVGAGFSKQSLVTRVLAHA